MTIYSPLRYPGGKGKISEYFKKVVLCNKIAGCTYVEPYAGGASVGLSLLFDGFVSNIVINDIDRSIYAFWYSVLHRTDAFCELIETTPVTIEEWHKQKDVQKKKKSSSLLKLGFSTFFLNRTNRSGIINAGVIGGLKQDGKWKLNARYNIKELVYRIRKIAEYRDFIDVYNADAVKLIKILKKKLSGAVLFYLDPPYFIKGQKLYLNYYSHDDHKEVADEIRSLVDHHWIVSYDNVSKIRELYAPCKKMKFSLNYSAANFSKGTELMIFSESLSVPRKISTMS